MAKDEFTAFLGPDTEYQGELAFKGIVRIDCRFTGTITAEGKLILGKDALLEGVVTVKDFVVHGVFNGQAIVANRTTLHREAKVTGSLTTQSLVMEEGASLQGDLCMRKSIELPESANEPAYISNKPKPGLQLFDAEVKQ